MSVFAIRLRSIIRLGFWTIAYAAAAIFVLFAYIFMFEFGDCVTGDVRCVSLQHAAARVFPILMALLVLGYPLCMVELERRWRKRT